MYGDGLDINSQSRLISRQSSLMDFAHDAASVALCHVGISSKTTM